MTTEKTSIVATRRSLIAAGIGATTLAVGSGDGAAIRPFGYGGGGYGMRGYGGVSPKNS